MAETRQRKEAGREKTRFLNLASLSRLLTTIPLYLMSLSPILLP